MASRRDPSCSVVNRVLREHLGTLLARFVDAHGGRTLPAHVERELRAAVTRGEFVHGFWRVRRQSCRLGHLVASSCKGRRFRASRCGKRMAEVAAHLSGDVVPYVPVRQWVLLLPWELRFRLIAASDLCLAVASALLGAVFARCVRMAKTSGHCLGSESYAHPGAVPPFRQVDLRKFGSALQVNPHFHALWNLRRPWRDGTRGFVFDPLTFMGWLAALVPHSRKHQLTYHGCSAPASPLRDHVVLRPPSSRPHHSEAAGAAPS